MCRSPGLMVPFGSTRLVLSAVGISFSTGWASSRPVVISMPSSAIALLDDQDVVVRAGTGLRPQRRSGRPDGRGAVVVDDEDVFLGRLDDRRRLLGRGPALPRRIREPDHV